MFDQKRIGILRPMPNNNRQNARLEVSVHSTLAVNTAIQVIMQKCEAKCYFCGFVDERYLEACHLNGNHNDHSEDNIVPACTMCHSQNHVFSLALEQKAEICVLSPHFTQAQFNQLQRILLVLSYNTNSEASHFARIYRQKILSEPLKKHQRPNPIKISSVEYRRMMFVAVEIYNNVRGNQSNIDPNIYFTEIDYNSEEEFEEARKEDTQSANIRLNDQINKYKEWFLKAVKENRNFSLYQLAKILEKLSDESYNAFTLPNHYLLFKPSIFTNEQYEYYLSQPLFKQAMESLTASFQNKGVTIE